MGSTNYTATFIQVAEDCPAVTAQEPPVGTAKGRTVTALQFALISQHPYEFTSDHVLFDVHASRQSIPAEERQEAREAFFAKDQACLRSSPLGKRYGWGIHHDDAGHVALVGVNTEEYDRLAADPAIRQVKAMRSKRA